MLINTFWKILLKIIGLLILFGSFSIIPQFTSTLFFIEGSLGTSALLGVWGLFFASLLVYFFIVRFFVFKTDWIIEKLKLDKNFKEERIEINYSSTSILTICVIIFGALISIEALPNLISRLFDFLTQKSQFKDYSGTSWLIYYFFKLILGYLLLTNGKAIANYIERKSK
jgi:hypothetical protein